MTVGNLRKKLGGDHLQSLPTITDQITMEEETLPWTMILYQRKRIHRFKWKMKLQSEIKEYLAKEEGYKLDRLLLMLSVDLDHLMQTSISTFLSTST